MGGATTNEILPSKVGTLNLLIDKKNWKVVYAEADKKFIDFLCHMMVLPVGVLLKLTEASDNTASSLGTLYNSIKNLDSSYIDPRCNLEFILNPPSFGSTDTLLSDEIPSAVKNLYVCCANGKSSCLKYVSRLNRTPCPSCTHGMSQDVTFAGPPPLSWEGGYVKSPVTYMVLDDLAVMPLSTDTCFKVISPFNLDKAKDLERKVVDVGMDQVIKLVNASLNSKTVLSDVFLRV